MRKEIPVNTGRSRLNLSGSIDVITHEIVIQENQTLNADSTIRFFQKIEDYGALDGEPVTILFFLFACDDKRHLHLLAKIAHLSSRPQTLELLLSKPNKTKLLEVIKEWESNVGKALSKS